MGAAWAVTGMVSFRILIKTMFGKRWDIVEPTSHRMIIVGSEDEAERTLSLLTQSGGDHRLIGFVSPNGQVPEGEHFLGSLDELPDIREIYQVDEVIFCGKDLAAQQIISSMVQNGPGMNYKNNTRKEHEYYWQ